MNSENSLFFLIRRGKEEHIRNLYEKGELYINTISFLRSCDDNPERTDSEDCLVFRPGNKYVNGNIFCFYGIYCKHLNIPDNFMDVEIESFGDWLILIHSPSIFIERVEKELKGSGYNVTCEKVEYYREDYVGEVGVFKKHERFEKQCEYRFFIENEYNQTIKNIYIGSLAEIATIERNLMMRLTLDCGSKKVFYIRQQKERETPSK